MDQRSGPRPDRRALALVHSLMVAGLAGAIGAAGLGLIASLAHQQVRLEASVVAHQMADGFVAEVLARPGALIRPFASTRASRFRWVVRAMPRGGRLVGDPWVERRVARDGMGRQRIEVRVRYTGGEVVRCVTVTAPFRH